VAKRGRNVALAEKAVFESQSFTDKEAFDNQLIDLIAAGDRDLIAHLDRREPVRFDGRRQVLHVAGAKIINYEKTVRENLLSRIRPEPGVAVADPGRAGNLRRVRFTRVDFSRRGRRHPLLLGLTAIALLPINWVGAVLMVLALVLFVLEAKITSHGILGIGGAAAMVLGVMLLIDSPVPEMRIHPAVAVSVGLPFACC